MIRFLLLLVVVTLFFVAYYLNKNKETFSQVLGEGNQKPLVKTAFKNFAKACFVLAVIGIVLIIFSNKVVSLTYVAIVLVVSAIFSILLSKLIS